MILLKLKKYLNEGGYYNLGVQLLKELGHDKVEMKELEGYVKQDFAPRSFQKKVDTLILGYYNSLIETNHAPSVFQSIQVEPPPIKPINEPSIITELRNESRQLQDDRRFLHSSLLDTEGKDERLNKCQRIRSLTKRIDKIWAIIDDFETTGNVPIQAVSKEKTAVDEVMELNTKVLSLRPRICKLKKWIQDDTIGTTKKTRYKNELAEKEMELEKALKQLNQLK